MRERIAKPHHIIKYKSRLVEIDLFVKYDHDELPAKISWLTVGSAAYEA